MAEFKDRLKQLRKERGLTQKELAEIFKTTGVAIGRYEKGLREPNNLDTLIGLAQFFDVSTDYLLGLSDERKKNSD